jgi:endonuclease YncB( thermonuclease family)
MRKLLLFTLLLPLTLFSVEFTGKCVGVIDGDAILVMENGKEVRIRLWGIDAPEKDQAFGIMAKKYLSDAVFGKPVKVEMVDNDMSGTAVGKVYHNAYINLKIVKDGLAWHYVKYAPNDKALRSAEKEARDKRRGLWSHTNPTPPWEWRKGVRLKTTKRIKKVKKSASFSTSVRCSGTTKRGTRCKRRTKHPSGRCWQHR